ncbi:unnamed protein product, partial [Polarella glacialis]
TEEAFTADEEEAFTADEEDPPAQTRSVRQSIRQSFSLPFSHTNSDRAPPK